MAFCQRFCNWVCQPPLQLRGVGIYSHGCKQGCFQPCRPSGPDPGRLLDFAIMQQGRWYRVAGAAKFTWARPLGYLNEWYEQRSFEAVGVLTVLGLPRPTWENAPATLGLGLAWLVSCGRRTSRSAQRTRSLSRTGVHTGLKNPYSTGPTNWLACTRSTGYR